MIPVVSFFLLKVVGVKEQLRSRGDNRHSRRVLKEFLAVPDED